MRKSFRYSLPVNGERDGFRQASGLTLSSISSGSTPQKGTRPEFWHRIKREQAVATRTGGQSIRSSHPSCLLAECALS